MDLFECEELCIQEGESLESFLARIEQVKINEGEEDE